MTRCLTSAVAVSATLALSLINSGGPGIASPVDATPPAAPSGLVATPGNFSVRLNWTAPPRGAAAPPLVGYRVAKSTCCGGPWTTVVVNTHSTRTVLTVGGLTNGVAHYFRVAAINAGGVGSYTATDSGTTTRTLPGRPRNGRLDPGDGEVVVRWAVPAAT